MSSRSVDPSTDRERSLRVNAAIFAREIIARVLTIAAMLVAVGTTATGAPTHAYDAPTVAGVGAHASEGPDARTALLSVSQEGSVSLSVQGRSTPTTPTLTLVATNTADDVLRLGTKDSWGNLNTLDDHFARHGADFGATSADDYARQASEFLQQPGTLTKIDPKTGVIRVYDPATEAFGAYSPTGTTRTFYIPDPAKHGYPTNLDYWNAQPG